MSQQKMRFCFVKLFVASDFFPGHTYRVGNLQYDINTRKYLTNHGFAKRYLIIYDMSPFSDRKCVVCHQNLCRCQESFKVRKVK